MTAIVRILLLSLLAMPFAGCREQEKCTKNARSCDVTIAPQKHLAATCVSPVLSARVPPQDSLSVPPPSLTQVTQAAATHESVVPPAKLRRYQSSSLSPPA